MIVTGKKLDISIRAILLREELLLESGVMNVAIAIDAGGPSRLLKN